MINRRRETRMCQRIRDSVNIFLAGKLNQIIKGKQNRMITFDVDLIFTIVGSNFFDFHSRFASLLMNAALGTACAES